MNHLLNITSKYQPEATRPFTGSRDETCSRMREQTLARRLPR